MTVPVAGALGDRTFLAEHVGNADIAARDAAFGLAVINGEREAAEDLLAAGAEINAHLLVHAHGTALHQAVANGDLPMIEMLLGHGAHRYRRHDVGWHGARLGDLRQQCGGGGRAGGRRRRYGRRRVQTNDDALHDQRRPTKFCRKAMKAHNGVWNPVTTAWMFRDAATT